MKLWNHQRKAAEFILSRQNAIIYADMGTGKTGAAISALVQSGAKKAVIVCPPRVIMTWEDQLRLWGYAGPVTPLTQPSTIKRMAALADAPPEGVVLINYQGYWRDPLFDALRYWGAEVVIYDEVHNLKAPGSKQSRKANTWFAQFGMHVGLTGTLIANGRQDIYGQARAVRPDLFGTNYNNFVNKYLIMGGYENRQVIGYRNSDDYERRLNEFVMTVDNTDLIDLPDVVVQDWTVRMMPKTKKAAKEVKEEMITETEAGFITASNVLVKSTRLRQLASGIASVDGGGAVMTDTSKVEAALEWLDGVGPHPTIVWINYVAEGEELHRAASKAGYRISRVFAQHDEYRAWVNGDTDVLIISIQAGAEGLNDMVRSRHVLYFSPTYSLIKYEQSFKRTHRPGADLNHKVHYTRLVAEGSIEKGIYKALSEKRNMAIEVFNMIRNST